MSSGPNYYDPNELFGDQTADLDEDGAGEIEIVPDPDGDGFSINGDFGDIVEFFTSGILGLVEQGAEEGQLSGDQVADVIKAVAQIRETLDLD